MALIGDLCQSAGIIKVDWKIQDFSSLSLETDIHYHSPKFYFSGASWQIVIFPNGISEQKTNGWINLFIERMSTGFGVKLHYQLTLKTYDGKIISDMRDVKEINSKYIGWGAGKLILRSAVTEKVTKPTFSNILIVTCTLKNCESYNIKGSLFSRYETLSDSLKEIYKKKTKTDCILKVKGVDLSAHRMILETRSPVFGAMFNHDTKESQRGEIVIDDIDKSAMEAILMYMYSGDIHHLTKENVLSMYSAAEKYDIKEVKDICMEFIIRNLSEDWVCDVIKFNELFQDENIGHRIRRYFTRNVRKILKTEKWKTFAKENPEISIKLLSSVVIVSVPE